MGALLTSVGGDKDRSAVYLAECRRMGIRVLPPDVNESRARFAAVGTDIRFGLAAVRNVGTHVVDSIVRARREKGAFTDFYDFLRKVDAVVCNKKTIESLIKAGAFDSLGHTRRGLLAVHADAIDSFVDVKRNEAVGQFDLFGDSSANRSRVTPPISRPSGTRPTCSRSNARCSACTSPITRCSAWNTCSTGAADMPISTLFEEGTVPDGQILNLAGILSGVQRRITKQGRAGRARRWRTSAARSR